MEDGKLDNMLKTYLSRQQEVPERGVNCPPLETLGRYVSGAIESHELYNVSGHIKSCASCSETVEAALLYSAHEKHINIGTVSNKIKEKAKSLHPAYKTKEYKIMGHLRRNLWFMLSLASLAASFFVARYFLQFLILAVIFGLKWVFNRESTRTLIMIYNAWKKHDKDSDRKIEEIFKSRF